jgi:hypothetical protein
MTYYCRYHDITLCPDHREECLGGDRCETRDLSATEISLGYAVDVVPCSVCCGVLKPLDERR